MRHDHEAVTRTITPDIQVLWDVHARSTIPALLYDKAGTILGSNRAMLAIVGPEAEIPATTDLLVERLWNDNDARSRIKDFLAPPFSRATDSTRPDTILAPPHVASRRIELTLHAIQGNNDGTEWGLLYAHERGGCPNSDEINLQGHILDALMHHIPDQIYFKDRDSKFVSVNHAVIKYLGLTELDRAIGKSDFDFFDRGQAEAFYLKEQDIIRTGIPHINEREHITSYNGRSTWLSISKLPWYDKSGNIIGTCGINRNITRQVEAEMALHENEEKYRVLIEHLPQKIFFKDRDLRFVSFNKNFARDMGARPEDIIGKTDFDFSPKELAEKYRADDLRIMESGTIESLEERHVVDGNEIIVQVVKTPVWDENGTVTGILGIFWDITEQTLNKQDLERKTAELERSNRELEQFAYIASHDLQEPLRKIQAFGDRLESKYADSLPEKAADYLQRMQNAAGRMSELINSLLSFSRLTTQAKPFEPVDLDMVIAKVTSDLEIRIADSDGSVQYGSLPTIEGDRIQIGQLFQNLIGNALKFHREDIPPEIVIQSHASPAGNGFVDITVTDNGIGFEQKYAERIFQMFQRLHGRDAYEGTGVGLSICKKIVERHHGSIAVNSIPDEGTTFTVTLKLAQREDIV